MKMSVHAEKHPAQFVMLALVAASLATIGLGSPLAAVSTRGANVRQ